MRTEENPADLGTRGDPIDLKSSWNFWFYGPSWIREDRSSWPDFLKTTEDHLDDSEFEKEVKRIKPEHLGETQLVAVQEERSIFWKSIDLVRCHFKNTRLSKFRLLLRVTALILRAVKKFKEGGIRAQQRGGARPLTRKLLKSVWKKGKSVPPNTFEKSEILEAEKIWVKLTQEDTDKTQKEILYSLRQLGPYVDESGIVRLKGRLQNADISDSSKIPMWLPAHSYFTDLVVKHYHLINGHCGASHTLADIREKFWISTGKSVVMKIIRNCMVCKKFRTRPFVRPEMAPLPGERVGEISNPFRNVGLDSFGPIPFMVGEETVKGHCYLFTCMQTRAIHLELVPNLNLEEFLLAYERFVARFSTPEIILSDNALQFKAAEKALCQKTNHLISPVWKFISSLSPWKGGFYERLVGVVKDCLRKNLTPKCLGERSLQTLLLQVEKHVNLRPLTENPADPDDWAVIRPIDFLQPFRKGSR